MSINGFLGRLVNAPRICNDFSYNLALFGTPLAASRWGFSFYGHHLCLNILLYRNQIVVSPCFTRAKPNVIDDPHDPYVGTRILQEEERLSLQLMQSLPSQLQSNAQVYKLFHDPSMPHGRWNHDDQRQLCGAYRDNRVMPYEGVEITDMTTSTQELVTAILSEFLLYLPSGARRLRLKQAESWYHVTYFCWIGEYGNDDAFYYGIQSPVIIVEFDHHSGVFLNNEDPAKFHIHTLLRTPNGGNYGMAMRSLMGTVSQAFVCEK
jgi:hypothetical protein